MNRISNRSPTTTSYIFECTVNTSTTSTRKVPNDIAKISTACSIEIKTEDVLTIGDRPMSIEATTFLYNFKQKIKHLDNPEYKSISGNLDVSPQLVANNQTKQIVKLKVAKMKILYQNSTRQTYTQNFSRGWAAPWRNTSENEEGTTKPWEALKVCRKPFWVVRLHRGARRVCKELANSHIRELKLFLQRKNAHIKDREFLGHLPGLTCRPPWRELVNRLGVCW